MRSTGPNRRHRASNLSNGDNWRRGNASTQILIFTAAEVRTRNRSQRWLSNYLGPESPMHWQPVIFADECSGPTAIRLVPIYIPGTRYKAYSLENEAQRWPRDFVSQLCRPTSTSGSSRIANSDADATPSNARVKYIIQK